MFTFSYPPPSPIHTSPPLNAVDSTCTKCLYCQSESVSLEGGACTKTQESLGHLHCGVCKACLFGIPRRDTMHGEATDEHLEDMKEVRVRSKPAEFEVLDIYRNPCRMISVVVGHEGGLGKPKKFTIHAPLLSASSAYFHSILKMPFGAESGESGDLMNELCIEGPDVSVFGLVNEYLNTGKISAPRRAPLYSLPPVGQPEDVPLSEKRKVLRTNLTWMTKLCRVWLLAHCLEMPELVNYAMWCLLLAWDEGLRMCSGDIENIYCRAPAESKLRELLEDLCAWDGEEFSVTTKVDPIFAWEIMAKESIRKRKGRCPLLDVRNYYVGEEGEKASGVQQKKEKERRESEREAEEEGMPEWVAEQLRAFTFTAAKHDEAGRSRRGSGRDLARRTSGERGARKARSRERRKSSGERGARKASGGKPSRKPSRG